jgi:hypothetical protein
LSATRLPPISMLAGPIVKRPGLDDVTTQLAVTPTWAWALTPLNTKLCCVLMFGPRAVTPAGTRSCGFCGVLEPDATIAVSCTANG